MPFLLLVPVALSVGAVVALLAARYPTPVVGERPAAAAAEAVGHEAAKHHWLHVVLSRRLDPATATGLALTAALGVAIVGGLVIGVLAYLTRTSDRLVELDRRAGQWGADHATEWSTDAIQLVTELGGTWFVLAAAVAVSAVEIVRTRNRWIPAFLLTVVLGEVILVNAIKEVLDRVRPTFNPITETLGPSFPSGHSATAAAFYAAAALVLSRGRTPRVRALLAGGGVAIAVGVAESRVLLGVHWLSDVVAGLAFGWAWFALCAIAFGGRLLRFGAPAETAARIADREDPRSV